MPKRRTVPAPEIDTTALLSHESRTSKRRQVLELLQVGQLLLELDAATLNSGDLPEPLLGAVLEGRRLKRQALARQKRHICRLLRDDDDAATAARTLVGMSATRRRTAAEEQRQLEDWRFELVEARDPPLEALLARADESEHEELFALVTEARREFIDRHPPHAQRQLFRRLRQLLTAGGGRR